MGEFIMRARFYERKDRLDRWVVYLSWKGEKYKRYHYDGDIPLVHKQMAEQIASAINADIKSRGKNFDPRQWFRTPSYELEFKSYANKWLGNQKHYAPSVIRDVRRYIRFASDFFNRKDIREIRKGDIEDFLNYLPERLSPKTKSNALGVIHKLFRDAFDREEILRVPGFPNIPVPEPEIKWVNREWQDKIIAAIDPRDRPIFIFLRTYGARPGEARALQWDCVDFEKGIISIKRTFSGSQLREVTKNKKIRYLPFTAEIERLLKSIRGVGGFVFRNRQGRPYTADISRIWNEARDGVGAPRVTLYQGTRHSLGCQKLSEGHNIEHLRELYGHSRVDMTQRYAKASAESLRRLLE